MANQFTGAGLTAVFNTTNNMHTLMSIKSVSLPALRRNSIETTHIASTQPYRTFIPSQFVDAGEITLRGDMDVTAAATTTLVWASSAPVTGTLVIVWKNGTSTLATWTCASAFITSVDLEAPYDDVVTGSVTFKLSGAITIT